MSEEIINTIKLRYPIQFGDGEPIRELKFREITGADMEDFPLGSAKGGDFLRLAAKLTEHTPAVLRKAKRSDILAIVKAVESQLADGQETGET